MEVFIVWMFFAFCTAAMASNKGRSTGGWFILGCIGGVFALILVAVLSSKKPHAIMDDGEIVTPDTHVRCPECRELVRRDAKRCKHCLITLIPQ